MGTLHLHPRSGDLVPAVPPGPGRTLGGHAEDVDASRYQMPPLLLRRADALLAPDSTTPILVLTGRAGSGKTAALRAIARSGLRQGWRVIGPDGAPLDLLDAAGRGAGESALIDAGGPDADPAPLVLLDALEPEAAGTLGVRLAALPAASRVVVAARDLPPRWLPAALEPLACRHRLGALPDDEAHLLLQRYDVRALDARNRIVAWAGGLPLALVIGAVTAATADPALDLDVALVRDGHRDLIGRLAGRALDDIDRDVLAVLAVAAGIDQSLLTALFPGRSAGLLARLGANDVTEYGSETDRSRVHLHPSLAAALTQRMRAEEPARAAAAVLRVAGYEHGSAVAGETGALVRLATLVQDPALRAAIGATGPSDYYADHVRDVDRPFLVRRLEAVQPGLAPLLAPWLVARPEPTVTGGIGHHVRVVRQDDGRPVAVVAALPLGAAAAVGGPARRLIAPLVDHARSEATTDGAVVTAFQITLDERAEPDTMAARNVAALAASGVGNPRFDLVNLLGRSAEEVATLTAWGYTEVPDLAREVDGVPVTTWTADVGAGGLAGRLHAAITLEQGHPIDEVPGAVLVEALEHFHRDADLARLGVAPRSLGVAAAAAHTRAWARSQAIARLTEEPVLLDLVVRRYIDPGATHDSVMRATYSSRATYFRRLRRAREVLASPSSDR